MEPTSPFKRNYSPLLQIKLVRIVIKCIGFLFFTSGMIVINAGSNIIENLFSQTKHLSIVPAEYFKYYMHIVKIATPIFLGFLLGFATFHMFFKHLMHIK